MTDIQPNESGQPRKRRKAAQPNSYDAAVAEAKQILQNITTAESGRMRLGELAAQVETDYGEETLKKFAKEIDMALCTLLRSRSVYRAWAEIKATPPNFSVAQELQKLPDRAQIIKNNPNISTREARKKRLQYDKQEKRREQSAPGWQLKEYKKWFKGVVEHANTMESDAQIVDDPLDPARRKILCQAIEPNLLAELRESGNAAIKLADFLQRLLDEASGDETSPT
jgi:hypothetical protein